VSPKAPATQARRIEIQGDLPRAEQETAERAIAKLERYAGRPFEWARMTIRQGPGRSKRPYVVDAAVQYGDRFLAAHASGPGPREAVDDALERLRKQVERVKDAREPVAFDRRHRPDVALEPPEERKIVRRRTYTDEPKMTRQAVRDLLDSDAEFLLFRHVESGEDLVVYRREDGQIGLIHPPGSPVADDRGIVIPEEMRNPQPMTVDQARAQLDPRNERFLYFIDAEDGRGKVLYLRHDGDYWLVEPA
jgi:ribosome-associated translation inhibitor RaiA